jgi:hypothetical protein
MFVGCLFRILAEKRLLRQIHRKCFQSLQAVAEILHQLDRDHFMQDPLQFTNIYLL